MKSSLFLSLPLLLGAALASAAPPLTVSWREKPPYYYTEEGVEKGFMLAYAKEVFKAAGFDAQFVREPQKRTWAKFHDGTRNFCSSAWYRIPEREAIAQFSIPVYTDPPPLILIAPGSVARVKAHPTLTSLMADPSLTLGLVDGVSYGPELDARIAQSANQLMRRTVSTTNIMQMLAAGRVSYLIDDRNDWIHLRAHFKELAVVVPHEVPDLPAGMKRHFVCSRDLPAAAMAKLNQAIRSLPKPAAPEQ
jgi:polar amino acid transport system substrate-binding protein